MKNKKAQIAIELLSTYGFVILISVGILGALIYMNVFEFSVIPDEGCSFYSGIGCLDARINNVNVDIYIRNEIGFGINNIQLILNSTQCNSFANTSQDVNGSNPSNRPYLDNGDESLYTIHCGTFSSSKLDADLTLKFRNIESNQTHQKKGILKLTI